MTNPGLDGERGGEEGGRRGGVPVMRRGQVIRTGMRGWVGVRSTLSGGVGRLSRRRWGADGGGVEGYRCWDSGGRGGRWVGSRVVSGRSRRRW